MIRINNIDKIILNTKSKLQDLEYSWKEKGIDKPWYKYLLTKQPA